MAKKKKTGKKRTKKRGREFLLFESPAGRIIFYVVLSAAILAGIYYGGKHFFTSTKFFSVREIIVNKDRGYSFSEGENKLKRLYGGRNLFTIDLDQVRTLIRNDFPQLRKAEVRRIMPDRLEVDIVSRDPFAVIDSGGGVVVDKDGVVLAIGEGGKNLINIKGLNFFLNVPSRGEKIDNKALGNALVLLDTLRSKMRGSWKLIEYIDISERDNIILNISGVKVKMGIDEFPDKVNELRDIIEDPNIDLKDIRYIDLRFDDPVISPK